MAIIIIIIIPCIIWCTVEIIFACTHKRPLTSEEATKLAKKRRKKYISNTFVYQAEGGMPSAEFKSSLKPKGGIYKLDMSLTLFPSYVANLLKGKKHEWVVLGLVKDAKVVGFYANKGPNNKIVTYNCNFSELLGLAKSMGCQTILRLHNHPNHNPSKYNCLLASEQDYRSAKSIGSIVTSNNMNWIDFVCERGRFIVFYKNYSENYYPSGMSPIDIMKENEDENKYYRMQRELGIFR